MKLNKCIKKLLLGYLAFMLLIKDSQIYADKRPELADPMIPKTIKAPASQEKNTTSVETDSSEKVLQLSALGYNGYQMYCVINGLILSVNDTIDEYIVKDINDDEIILINKDNKVKKLRLD